MKTNIKVRTIEDQIIEDVFSKKIPEEIDTPEVERTLDKEKTVSISGDWKSFVIVFLVIILTTLFIGYNIQDKGLEENINVIKQEKRNIFIQRKNIEKANESISGSEAKIETSKGILKDKYQVIHE